MAELRKGRAQSEVLCYRLGGASQGTVRRHYLRWRQEQDPPLPKRCDNPLCFFHTNPLIWNRKEIKPILDRINGNNSDNRPKNLRLLCPICDSQLETRGGANKGRIKKAEGWFAQVSPDGKRHYVLPAETGKYQVSVQEAKLVFAGNSSGSRPTRRSTRRVKRRRAG